MRDVFRHHYAPTKAEIAAIWARAVIALDANVLLNLYRYSDPTRTDLLTSLEGVRQQLFLPHQAGEEFFRNRPLEMNRQVQKFEKATKELTEARESLWGLYRAPVREKSHRQEKLDAAFKELEEYLKAAGKNAIRPTADIDKDPVLKQLTQTLEGRVGMAPSQDHIRACHERADARFSENIPPGYKDADKDGPRRYGDALLWFELLQKAQDEERPVILVTDDGKEDWWAEAGQFTLGPRPELVAEMRSEAGQAFHMYKPAQFMEFVGQARQESIAEASSLPGRAKPLATPRDVHRVRLDGLLASLAKLSRDISSLEAQLAASDDRGRREVISIELSILKRDAERRLKTLRNYLLDHPDVTLTSPQSHFLASIGHDYIGSDLGDRPFSRPDDRSSPADAVWDRISHGDRGEFRSLKEPDNDS